MIFVDGKLGLCGCRDYNADSELIVGDIRKESLQEIWRSDKVRMLREKFWKGKQPEICKTCTAYSNLDIYRSKIGSERARFTAEKLASKK
jgi:radical SAM protein with 4Fe4S-binding SPASM domain